MQKQYRESNRWQFWDYSSPGRYFITICSADKLSIFGKIVNSKPILSEEGKIVSYEILKIPNYHERALLDEWIIMPNHIHLIIELKDYELDEGIAKIPNVAVEKIHEFSLQQSTEKDISLYKKKRRRMLIPKIIGKFKMLTSKKINLITDNQSHKNWQTSYHDHVIRHENAYWRIKKYIQNNPANWKEDEFYVEARVIKKDS